MGDIFQNKWTVQNGGKQTFDGWSKESFDRFEELRAWNKAARAKPETKTLEEACLAHLREETGRTAPTIDEERAKKRRKVRATLVEEEEEDDDIMDQLFD